MGELGKYLRVCMVYASIPLMYCALGMLKLAYLISPEATLKMVKRLGKNKPGLEEIMKNAESAEDVKFLFSDEFIKV